MMTPRQREVAALIARGLSNKEIGHELGLAEGTVKAYANALYAALGLSAHGNSRVRAALHIARQAYE